MLDVELASRFPAPMLLGVAAIILLLGTAGLIARERRSPVTISFFLLTVAAAVWLASTANTLASPSEARALFWGRVTYVGVACIPAAVLQFSLSLANALRRRRVLLIATWLISAGFVALFAFTGLFITGIYRYDWGHYVRLGPASVLFLLFFVVVLASSLGALSTSLSSTDATEHEKRRIRSFFSALAVGYAASVDFLPSFGIDIIPIGFAAVLGFIVLSIHAIWRYHFVDLSPSFVADQLLDTVPGGVLAVDTRGRIRVANAAAAELLGLPVPELIGRDLRTLVRSQTLPVTDSQTFTRAGRTRNRLETWPRPDGSMVELSVTATMLRDRNALPVGILYVLRDLAEQRRAERNEFAANHDSLTGIPNRAYVANRFEPLAADIGARGRIAALMFLDLDGFKAVNDRHGHAFGDKVLQVIAARMRRALRDDDIAARQGGDEFLVMVSLGNRADASIVAAKLEAVIRQTVTIDAVDVRLGVSIGTAIFPDDGEDFSELMSVADSRMYRVKQAGTPARREVRTDRVAPSPLISESRA